MTNLKRLQSSNQEPLRNTTNVSAKKLNNSPLTSDLLKSANNHKLSISTYPSYHHRHHHHHHHHHHHRHHQLNKYRQNLPKNCEKKHRLPSLLQRLINEGNLIKEAVHRLKSRRFSSTSKLQREEQIATNNPSTPATKSSRATLSNLTSQLTSSPSINMNTPHHSTDSPTQTTSSSNIHQNQHHHQQWQQHNNQTKQKKKVLSCQKNDFIPSKVILYVMAKEKQLMLIFHFGIRSTKFISIITHKHSKGQCLHSRIFSLLFFCIFQLYFYSRVLMWINLANFSSLKIKLYRNDSNSDLYIHTSS